MHFEPITGQAPGPRQMVNLPVLVLNQNYEPLNVTRVRRAVVLVHQGKAEMLENGIGVIHTAQAALEIPSVIRLPRLVKRPRRERKMSRYEVLVRDAFTCQYCGRQHHDVTIDHVIPRSRQGDHTWENVVCACGRCNRGTSGTLVRGGQIKGQPTVAPLVNRKRCSTDYGWCSQSTKT